MNPSALYENLSDHLERLEFEAAKPSTRLRPMTFEDLIRMQLPPRELLRVLRRRH